MRTRRGGTRFRVARSRATTRKPLVLDREARLRGSSRPLASVEMLSRHKRPERTRLRAAMHDARETYRAGRQAARRLRRERPDRTSPAQQDEPDVVLDIPTLHV